MFEKKYSGDNSIAFWEMVNLIDDKDSTLYKLGCELQNLEEKVLSEIGKQCKVIIDLKENYYKNV